MSEDQPTVFYEWDAGKNRSNLAKHGLPLEAAQQFDWETARDDPDSREDYGEERRNATGFDCYGHVMRLCYTRREPNIIRFINYRMATKDEQALFLEYHGIKVSGKRKKHHTQ